MKEEIGEFSKQYDSIIRDKLQHLAFTELIGNFRSLNWRNHFDTNWPFFHFHTELPDFLRSIGSGTGSTQPRD
jgi:hypothetical protein